MMSSNNNNNRGDEVLLQPRYDLAQPEADKPTRMDKKPKEKYSLVKRPPQFTEQNKERILAAISFLAAKPASAAKYAAVSPRRLNYWLRRGEAIEEATSDPSTLEGLDKEFYDFYIAFQQQPAVREVALLDGVHTAASGYVDENGNRTKPIDITASTWYLEHVFGYNKRLQIGGSVDINQRIQQQVTIESFAHLSDEELDQAIVLASKLESVGKNNDEVLDAEIIEESRD